MIYARNNVWAGTNYALNNYNSPSLALTLSPAAIAPGAVATLTLADAHAGTLLPGLWYTIPITGTGGGVTQTTSVGLLVGGTRVWLPVVLRSCP